MAPVNPLSPSPPALPPLPVPPTGDVAHGRPPANNTGFGGPARALPSLRVPLGLWEVLSRGYHPLAGLLPLHGDGESWGEDTGVRTAGTRRSGSGMPGKQMPGTPGTAESPGRGMPGKGAQGHRGGICWAAGTCSCSNMWGAGHGCPRLQGVGGGGAQGNPAGVGVPDAAGSNRASESCDQAGRSCSAGAATSQRELQPPQSPGRSHRPHPPSAQTLGTWCCTHGWWWMPVTTATAVPQRRAGASVHSRLPAGTTLPKTLSWLRSCWVLRTGHHQ